MSKQKRAKNTQEGEQPIVGENGELKTIHCRRCRTLMENGVCPDCGFKMYVPMSDEQRKKIRKAGTIVGFIIFAVLYAILKLLQ
jgi:hypothetical protein